MAKHSNIMQNLHFPQLPRSPKDPWADERIQSSSGSPMVEGESSTHQDKKGQDGSVCRTRHSPSQDQALPPSPSLMKTSQYHPPFLPLSTQRGSFWVCTQMTAYLEAFRGTRKFSAHLSSCSHLLMGPSLMSGQSDCHLTALLDCKLHGG